MTSVRLFRAASKGSPNPVRPLNPNRDLAAVSRLLELVFRQNVGRNKRGALVPAYPNSWLPFNSAPVPGFVYDLNGRIVGNVSILESRDKGHYLVANVAVHPDYRRRGFAKELMSEVIRYTSDRQGKSITLQVEKENHSAATLYANLGFRPLGSTKAWQTGHHALKQIHVPMSARGEGFKRPDEYDRFYLRPLNSSDAKAALKIDRDSFPVDLQWSDFGNRNPYNRSVFLKAVDFLNGMQDEVWGAFSSDTHTLLGLGSINTVAGKPHLMRIRIPQSAQELVLRPILAKCIRRIKYMSRRPILIDFLEEETALEGYLKEAGFRQKRILTTMRFTHSTSN